MEYLILVYYTIGGTIVIVTIYFWSKLLKKSNKLRRENKKDKILLVKQTEGNNIPKQKRSKDIKRSDLEVDLEDGIEETS